MSVALTKTEAEEQLARQFAETASLLPGGGWVPAARAEAMRAFERSGLPHRRIESWKYTDLRAGLKEAFAPAGCSGRQVDAALLSEVLGAELAALPAIRLVLVNGRCVARMVPEGQDTPDGCQLSALSGAIGQPDFDWMRARFNADETPTGEPDPVMALNQAFVTDGVVLHVAKGRNLSLPIHVVSIVDADAPKSVATRNLVQIGEGATATIIESHVALGSAPSQANAVTQLSVGEGAVVQHVKHVAAGNEAAHLARWDIHIAEGATYRGFQLTAGAGLLRNETHVAFEGPDARFDLSGLMLGRGADHIDTTLVLNHEHPGCESRELFKSVLDGHARAVFQGKVIVAPEAQKTDGQQMAQALMLSEDAEFDSKPELEIYADDVACGHGSTSAELDPGMLFYLRSRGIPKDEARSLLIQSFAGEALEKIDDEQLREALRTITSSWLRGAGA